MSDSQIFSVRHSTAFQISRQTSLDFNQHKQPNLTDKLYGEKKLKTLTRSKPAAVAVQSAASAKMPAIHFAIEFN